MSDALNIQKQANKKQKSARVSIGKPAVPFSANVWIASQALTRMSSSGELSSSTTVAGVLPSTGRGSNCECEEKDVRVL